MLITRINVSLMRLIYQGPYMTPSNIQWAEGLHKTRSGKIMRRLLRKIANHDVTDMGDLSTLADPGVVDQLIRGKVVG